MKNTKNILIEHISKDQFLRENLPFREHLKLFNYLNELTNDEIEFKLKDQNIPINNPLTKKNPWIRNGLLALTMISMVPFSTTTLITIRDSQRIPCIKKCHRKNIEGCVSKCIYLSTKFAVDILEKELKKCNKNPDPKKCRKNIFKLMQKWKPQLEKEKLDYEFKQKKKNHIYGDF
jgi:hypothetical protein